ncbi:MAG: hypothetical protein WA003_16365, partial [Desulfuromonadaceae bacterium]
TKVDTEYYLQCKAPHRQTETPARASPNGGFKILRHQPLGFKLFHNVGILYPYPGISYTIATTSQSIYL